MMFEKRKTLKIKLDEGAKMPCYAHENDACMDIYANEDCTIESREYKVVKTGVHIEIPAGYEIQIRSRSGLAAKHGISVLNSPGTIDAGYTGEFGIILMNNGKEAFEVKKHDRIAQICLSKVCKMKFDMKLKLAESDRGDNGFGSTGRR